MAYSYLPQIVGNKLDGNLAILATNDNPVIMILGTAAKGESETIYRVDRVSDAVAEFGKEGNLIRGLYEVNIAGGSNIRLFRIGATSAQLVAIGDNTGAGGFTLKTIAKDDSAGTDYTLFYDDSTARLRVYRASDGELVYDNNPAYPLEKVDLGEVEVSGSASTGGGGGNIGTLSVPVTMAAADGDQGGTYPTYTAGTDGETLSLMETYEALYKAYKLLEDQDIDIVVPMGVYLDDLNVMDLTSSQITTRALTSLTSYPNPGYADDVLGKLYTEEYQGEHYFWWWFPSNPVSPSFSAAQIYPVGVGSATAALKTDGTALTAADFHEVNFAYQLADFCYRQSEVNVDMLGFVGVKGPNSLSLKDISTWVGTLPVTTESGTNTVVSTNGTGLLGNKFMSGRIAAGGLGSFTINGVAGLYNGGFVATDDGWLDGTHELDDNDHIVDIGKYLSVVATWCTLANPSQTVAYIASGAPTYAGFCSTLPPQNAPTNKILTSVALPYRINKTKLDLLSGQRLVTFHAKPKGIVVTDAPTAARPDSDYQRFSTIAQVKSCLDEVRRVAEPFLGNGIGGAELAALDTAIDGALRGRVKALVINRYEHQLSSTAQERVLGQAKLQLKIVPKFELREITVTVALAAV